MTDVFFRLLDVGILASVLIVIIAMLRFLLKKVPRTYFYVLWCVVGLRLLIPVEITGSFGIMPDFSVERYLESELSARNFNNTNTEVISDVYVNSEAILNSNINSEVNAENNSNINSEVNAENNGNINSEVNAENNSNINSEVNDKNNSNINSSAYENELIAENNKSSNINFDGWNYKLILTVVWAVGVIAMLLYLCISSLIFKRRLATAVPLKDNVYLSDSVDASFVFGIINPKIYMPYHIEDKEREMILVHENMHLRHKDNLVKVISFVILSMYWFLPTVWLFWGLFCRDMEGFCDESVIRSLGESYKKTYANALLACVERRKLLACPVAFGSDNIKERVKNVLNYKKTSLGIAIVLVLLTVVLIACLSPSNKQHNLNGGDEAAETTILETKGETIVGTKNETIMETNDDTLADTIVETVDMGETEKEETTDFEETEGGMLDNIVWYEDITHDGIDERIEVDLNDINNNSEGVDYKYKTVCVYSGQTDELIWCGHADWVHAGWDSFYVYKNPEDGLAYLIEWKPGMWQGEAEYSFKYFSLSETGEEIIAANKELYFTVFRPEPEDIQMLNEYVDFVNEYLRESYVLIDTDDGVIVYSEEGNPKINEFEIDEEIIELMEYYLNGGE